MIWGSSYRRAGATAAAAVVGALTLGLAPAGAGASPLVTRGEPGGIKGHRPNVVLITVDTLRYDRLSSHGYQRPTTPHLDALLRRGARFTQARVAEPLTAPSMVSTLTSLHPHEHGTTRNGLRMRPALPSIATILARRGYQTAAFVGNWTLKDEISGLGEHFGEYVEILNRKRWLGLFFNEASAEDVTAAAVDWLAERSGRRRPFLVWVHYVDPHAPYRLHKEFAPRLGISLRREVLRADRYDTEVAFVDRSIGDLLRQLAILSPPAETLIVFAADHGESLGEHGYWGHGRHLYDFNLRIPMGIVWEGRIAPRTVTALASNLDLAPTVLGLLGLPVPQSFRGWDWSGPLRGGGSLPDGRVTWHQAHKGAVQKTAPEVRRKGLLEVGRVGGEGKELLRIKGEARHCFDLEADPAEVHSRVELRSAPSAELRQWLVTVHEGLVAADDLPAPSLDEEAREQLRALGYIE